MVEKELKYIENIKNKFPQLSLSKVDFNFTDDLYNDIVIINDEIIFKFSKYDWTVAFLENEVKSIPFIQKYVFMHLPNMERLEKGIVKYNLIKGVPLVRDKILLLGIKEQDSIAEQLGTFLRQLHSISLKAVKSEGLADCPSCLTRDEWLSEYGEIQRKVFPYCQSYTKDFINGTFKPLIENESFLEFQPVLIHAGLASQHIIFDEESNCINGIIGLGLTGIGDPAYDISILLDHLGEAFVKRIAKYYRNINWLINRARFYSYANHLLWSKKLVDMITTRDFSHLQFSFTEADIMPIGSRL